eukprot:3699165-Rhodomonas_salina.1
MAPSSSRTSCRRNTRLARKPSTRHSRPSSRTTPRTSGTSPFSPLPSRARWFRNHHSGWSTTWGRAGQTGRRWATRTLTPMLKQSLRSEPTGCSTHNATSS